MKIDSEQRSDFFQQLRREGDRLYLSLYSLCTEQTFHERIEAARKRLQADRLKILVVGEFSRGKSTLINALVGEPVLPSGVNPTTACINILRGGSKREVTFHFADGTTETEELPQVKVNKYLKNKVTAQNEDIGKIREVHFSIPGRLDQLDADIVDTPGVNDLDATREEITYKYLHEADAVVLLLDAQQPLSESERLFLKEKVMGADIQRILYVVNKADEVLISGNLDDLPTIQAYIRKRLEEEIGVSNANIHMVSAKPTLKARHHGGEDESPVPFEVFETSLFQFANLQATTQRAKDHLARMKSIFEDFFAGLSSKINALYKDAQEASSRLNELDKEQKVLEARLNLLKNRLQSLSQTLGARVTSLTEQKVQSFRQSLLDELNGLAANAEEDALEDFRRKLSSHLRQLVETIETEAKKLWKEQALHLEAEFGDLLAHASSSVFIVPRKARDETTLTLSSSNKSLSLEQSQEESHTLQDFITSASLGFVGASLFGPIGIGAAILGQMFISRQRSEENARRKQEEFKKRFVQELQEQCDRLAERASFVGQHVAQREVEELMRTFEERTSSKLSISQTERESLRRSSQQTQQEKQIELKNVQMLKQQAETFIAQVYELYNQYNQIIAGRK